jgi:aminoglycoside phosphotransferase (APT) family kinase protein
MNGPDRELCTPDMASETSTVAGQIADLLRAQVPGARNLTVERVERVFGGNARRAWAGWAVWTDAENTSRREQIIMLTRAPGSQVQAEPEREYAVLRALHGTSVRAPRVWALDPEGLVTGGSSVVLQRMPGRADPVALLQARDHHWAREVTTDLARAAAELHTAEVSDGDTALGRRLGAVASADGGIDARATVVAQVEYWRSVYLDCRLEPLPVLAALFDWLLDNAPKPTKLAVVHGDLRPGNFLYDDSRIVALLDWEMVHLGDPAEDLGWIYRPLWSPQRLLDIHSFVRQYEEVGGPPVDPAVLLYHRAFAEVKFAAISIRAARAFIDGDTPNLRLADRAATVTTSLTLALELATELESLSKGALC